MGSIGECGSRKGVWRWGGPGGDVGSPIEWVGGFGGPHRIGGVLGSTTMGGWGGLGGDFGVPHLVGGGLGSLVTLGGGFGVPHLVRGGLGSPIAMGGGFGVLHHTGGGLGGDLGSPITMGGGLGFSIALGGVGGGSPILGGSQPHLSCSRDGVLQRRVLLSPASV